MFLVIHNVCTAFVSISALPVGENIRLVGGSSSMEGRVEIFHDNQWGTYMYMYVCSCNGMVVLLCV